MLRATTSLMRATGVLRRLTAAAASPLRTCHRAPISQTAASAPASIAVGLSTSFVSSAALTETKRGYARKPNPHDSNTEDLSNTFFDVQDVDADRLTHFYWDSNDNADSPYDTALLDSLLGEGEFDEWSGESLMFVDERDQPLLEEEYLR